VAPDKLGWRAYLIQSRFKIIKVEMAFHIVTIRSLARLSVVDAVVAF
jgi:hypothetical protein